MEIRRARPEDGPSFVDLVAALAAFEQLEPPDPAARDRLLRDVFADPPACELWVAVIDDAVVGYALFFATYSTFLAKPTLYLEDLFVHPDHRRQGIASAMMARLRRLAEERGCGRFEWSVLDWNEGAQALYRRLGAEPQQGWNLMRIVL